jgi:6-phosphogluconate dehydrogenase
LAEMFGHKFQAFAEDKVLLMERLKNAYALTRIINHEVGFSLIAAVSKQENWNLNFSEIARIWTNGCIIRSTLMEELVHLYKENDSLLRNKKMITRIKGLQSDMVSTIGLGLQHNFAMPVMSAAANYLFGRIIADSSANILQAQRDYFGAHTYQRKGDSSGKFYHTNWIANSKKTK